MMIHRNRNKILAIFFLVALAFLATATTVGSSEAVDHVVEDGREVQEDNWNEDYHEGDLSLWEGETDLETVSDLTSDRQRYLGGRRRRRRRRRSRNSKGSSKGGSRRSRNSKGKSKGGKSNSKGGSRRSRNSKGNSKGGSYYARSYHRGSGRSKGNSKGNSKGGSSSRASKGGGRRRRHRNKPRNEKNGYYSLDCCTHNDSYESEGEVICSRRGSCCLVC